MEGFFHLYNRGSMVWVRKIATFWGVRILRAVCVCFFAKTVNVVEFGCCFQFSGMYLQNLNIYIYFPLIRIMNISRMQDLFFRTSSSYDMMRFEHVMFIPQSSSTKFGIWLPPSHQYRFWGYIQNSIYLLRSICMQYLLLLITISVWFNVHDWRHFPNFPWRESGHLLSIALAEWVLGFLGTKQHRRENVNKQTSSHFPCLKLTVRPLKIDRAPKGKNVIFKPLEFSGASC